MRIASAVIPLAVLTLILLGLAIFIVGSTGAAPLATPPTQGGAPTGSPETGSGATATGTSPGTTTVTTTGGGAETTPTSPATSPSPSGGVLKLEGALNINVKSGDNVVSISRYDLTIVAGRGNITIYAVLPNPCYKIELNTTLDGVVDINIVSPARDQVCIQVLKPVSVTAPVTVPPSGELKVNVYLDGVLQESLTIRVSA